MVNAGETLPEIAARTVTFSAYANQADFRLEGGSIVYQNTPVLRMAETKLRGSHNIENLMATLAVGLARGLSFEQMLPPLCAYEPRPHRCEFVREVGGVTYINDSKATNLDAVEKALLAQNKSVILIAGGKDKGFTFETLRPLVAEKVRAAVLIGEMAGRIAQDWNGAVPCEIAHSLADAVERAHAMAQARRSRPLFSRERPPSTCSRATPIAAINFVPWCTLCPNKIMKLPHASHSQKTARHDCAPRSRSRRKWITKRCRSRT